jgi:hypothetical protein
MLNAVMMSVIILSVMAPQRQPWNFSSNPLSQITLRFALKKLVPRHFANVMFGRRAILSTWQHFIIVNLAFHNLSFCQPGIPITWHFVILILNQLSFCQSGIPSICHFVILAFHLLSFCQSDIQSTWHLVNLAFHQLGILSFWYSIKLTFCQFGITSICHFVTLAFRHLSFCQFGIPST